MLTSPYHNWLSSNTPENRWPYRVKREGGHSSRTPHPSGPALGPNDRSFNAWGPYSPFPLLARNVTGLFEHMWAQFTTRLVLMTSFSQRHMRARCKHYPQIHGYQWAWSCRHETHSQWSGEIACLNYDWLQSRVSMVASNEQARFLWIGIHRSTPLPRDIYIAMCYFPQPHHTLHTMKNLRGTLWPLCKHLPLLNLNKIFCWETSRIALESHRCLYMTGPRMHSSFKR